MKHCTKKHCVLLLLYHVEVCALKINGAKQSLLSFEKILSSADAFSVTTLNEPRNKYAQMLMMIHRTQVCILFRLIPCGSSDIGQNAKCSWPNV